MSFKDNLKEVVDAINENKLNVSPDVILDVACRLTNTQKIESNKESGKSSVKDDQPMATEKQIYALVNKFGIKEEVAEKLTKMEAMRIIEEKMKRSRTDEI